MASEERKELELLKLDVRLPSHTPVSGVEIVPVVRPRIFSPQSINFSWYRKQYPTCSVHYPQLATIQCMVCVKLKIVVWESYYCSQRCFKDAWKRHDMSHHDAANTTIGHLQNLEEFNGCGELADFDHSKSFDKNPRLEWGEWVEIGFSETYEPTSYDIGCPLKLECVAIDRTKGIHLSEIEVRVTRPVIRFPSCPSRQMVAVGSDEKYWNIEFRSHASDGLTFSVLSYNILADMYAKNVRTRWFCPRWALVWQYRGKNLLKEIIGYNADIICLQEVQDDHFESLFEPELTKRGYSALYKKKTNAIYSDDKYISEGCATFYRRDLFEEIMKYELDFKDRAKLLVDGSVEPELKRPAIINRLAKDNVALIVILQARKHGYGPQSRICVVNTHVHAGNEYPDVKVFQVATLIHELKEIVRSNMPLLICADLNSCPGSDPHTLLTKCGIKSVEENDPSLNPFKIERHIELGHSLQLESAYSSFLRSEGIGEKHSSKMNPDNLEPLFTMSTPKGSKTLDYILYTADRLRVEGLLELPGKEHLGETEDCYLPSRYWSSDHVALMARFRLLSQNAGSSYQAHQAPGLNRL